MAAVIKQNHTKLKPLISNFIIRKSSSAAAVDSPQEWENAKPYSEIPGPKPLPIPVIGNFWRFSPIGEYGKVPFHKLPGELINKYGPLVKVSGIGRSDVVYVSDPADSEKIFRTEGPWPARRGLDSFDYYRRVVRDDVFKNFRGVGTTQGEEWQKNRTILNKPMMRPQNVKNYHQPFQVIAAEFIEKMRTLRNENLELPEDFGNEMNKWALESIAFAALDTRIGCLDPKNTADSEGQILIKNVLELFDLMYQLDFLPSLWKFYSTPTFKRYIKTFDEVTSTCLKYINTKLEEVSKRTDDDPDGLSILEVLLKGENGREVAITMALDMLVAGIDTTSNATGFAMYNLAVNPSIQDRVYEELKKVMPNKGDYLPNNYMNSITYLKACIKESHRVTPVVIGTARCAGKNIVLKGYQIPEGTELVIPTIYIMKQEKYFKDADKFIPERWLKNEGPDMTEDYNPFGYLPFGFGPRMCIGRRLAEMEMHALLSQVFRNFKVSYNYGEMKVSSTLLNRPNSPLKFKLEERPN